MVVISALERPASCPARNSRSCSVFAVAYSSLSLPASLFFISSAAAWVNVMATIREILTLSLTVRLVSLSTRTPVLPAPADAETRTFVPSVSMASSCCLSNRFPMPNPFQPRILHPERQAGSACGIHHDTGRLDGKNRIRMHFHLETKRYLPV